MYAIVEIAGKQFKVREKDKLYVPLLKTKEQESVSLEKVLLVANDDDVTIGTPVVDGASVTATVLGHVKGDKVLVFKKRRRKRFKVLRGHRQRYTHLQIDALKLGNKKAASSKKEPASAEEQAA